MRIIDRYVLRELAGPFVIGLAGFSLMWLGNSVYEVLRLSQGQIAFSTLVRVAGYYVPYALVFGLPFASLLATALAFNRLGRDSEVTALRMGGMRLLRLVVPALVLGCVVTGAAFANTEWLAPWGNHAAANTIRRLILRQPAPFIQERVFFRAAPDYYVYIGRVDRGRRQLDSVMIYQLQPGGYPVIITARTATYRDRVWRLMEGVRHEYGTDGISHIRDTAFGELTVNLRQSLDRYWSGQKTPLEMSAGELKHQLDLFGKSGVVFLAAPLAIRFSRGGSFMGVLLAFVLAFCYQMVMAWSRLLGQGGFLPPALAAWSQNIVFAGVGWALLWRQE
jgi:lipopolysaccharide export system permease protein